MEEVHTPMTVDELIGQLEVLGRSLKSTIIRKGMDSKEANDIREEIDMIARRWFFDNYGSEIDGG